MRSVFEGVWDSVPGKVPVKEARDIGEHECNISGQGFGKDGGQCGKCIVGANRDPRDGAIGEDENGSDRVNVLLDLTRNARHVELILLNAASVGQPRRVQHANLGEVRPTHRTILALTNMPLLLINS